ncbi:hypothetical protein KGY64_05660 [Candidatus Bipolaricaulota bacterium]|nr:hypothetical protein [Candidatus Bipolaricaulota bacterium]
MKEIKNYAVGIFALLAIFDWTLPALAHAEEQGWGNHMPMWGGVWGPGPMIFFWTIGFLLIALLSVTLIKALRD